MTKLTMTSKINQGRYEASKTVGDLQRNGYFEQDGETYILLQCAYADNNRQQEAAFFADAVKLGDEIVDGVVPTYMVEWEIINPDGDDDGDACDWDNPIDINPYSDVTVEEC